MNINGNWMNFAYMDNPRLYGSGNAIQHLHYLPFGEDWVDQRNSSWNTPYTFSGKEKDVETGYGYFGARYYDSGLSIWLSVDPMSDKYPSMSPYNYCANNPIILVDPDGRSIFCLYVDDNNNVLLGHINKNAESLLETFAKTETGFAFLSLFASKGDKIGDVEFKKDGDFHEFNLYFIEDNSSGNIGGRYIPNEDGKLHFSIYLNTHNIMSKSPSLKNKLDYLLSIGHECFIHMSRSFKGLIDSYKNDTPSDFKTTMNNWREQASENHGDYDHYPYINGKPGFDNFFTYLGDLSAKYTSTAVIDAKGRHDKPYNIKNKNTKK